MYEGMTLGVSFAGECRDCRRIETVKSCDEICANRGPGCLEACHAKTPKDNPEGDNNDPGSSGGGAPKGPSPYGANNGNGASTKNDPYDSILPIQVESLVCGLFNVFVPFISYEDVNKFIKGKYEENELDTNDAKDAAAITSTVLKKKYNRQGEYFRNIANKKIAKKANIRRIRQRLVAEAAAEYFEKFGKIAKGAERGLMAISAAQFFDLPLIGEGYYTKCWKYIQRR